MQNMWFKKIFSIARQPKFLEFISQSGYSVIKEHLHDAECGMGWFQTRPIHLYCSEIIHAFSNYQYIIDKLKQELINHIKYDCFNCLWGAALHNKKIFKNLTALKYEGSIDYTHIIKSPELVFTHDNAVIWNKEIIDCDLLPVGYFIALKHFSGDYVLGNHEDCFFKIHQEQNINGEGVTVTTKYSVCATKTHKIGVCHSGL